MCPKRGMGGLASAESAALPYQQLRDGTPLEMMQCADGKILLQKNGRPACVGGESAQKLLQMGWEQVQSQILRMDHPF